MVFQPLFCLATGGGNEIHFKLSRWVTTMLNHPLIDYLSTLRRLSPALVSVLTDAAIPEHYTPHQVIQVAGHLSHRLWFVEQGLVQGYYLDKAERPHTAVFYTTQELIFLPWNYWQEAADLYLEVLQATRLWSVTYTQVQAWQDEFPEVRYLAGYFLRAHLRREQFRTRLLALPAESRYQELRRHYPSLFRQVPVRLLASWLNMTRENLSRLISRSA